MLSFYIHWSVTFDHVLCRRHHCINPISQIDQILLPLQFFPVIFDMFVVGDSQVVHFSTRALYILYEDFFNISPLDGIFRNG